MGNAGGGAPGVSLITVTYNNADVLSAFWGGYERSIAEWIVVDNASSDGSADIAAQLGATVVRLSENVGFSRANNRGAVEASGDVLLFVNPDVSVDRDGVGQLAAAALDDAALVAPQLINEDGSPQENGRGAPYPHRKLLHMARGHGSQSDVYSRQATRGERIRVVWVMGAAVAMSRMTFERIGGWNGRYFIYYEDAEICLRAMRHGYPTFVLGDVRWRHGWRRETARGFSWQAWRHEIRSGLRFYLTNFYCVLPLGRRGRIMRRVDAIDSPSGGSGS